MGDGNARTGRLEAGAADRRRVRRRAHRRLRGRLRGRRAVLLVLVQPRRPRGAGRVSGEHPRVQRRDATRAARRERGSPARRAAADPPRDAEGDHRHRGPPLLLEQRHRLHRDHARAEERRLGGRDRAGRVDDRAAARPQPLPHARSSRSAGSSPRPASRFSSTSNGARTASSPPTSTTSTSASRRTGSRPPPARTSACTRRTSRSSRRRCWRGCRRRRRRTTRSTGPTPRRRAGRRSYGRCSRRATYPRPVTDELSKARSACIRDRRPGSRARRT